MHARRIRARTLLLVRTGLLSGLLIGLAACVPGSVRIGTGGVSFGFSPVMLGFGGSSGHSGQYALPTATSGPRGVAATFHNEIACEDRIGTMFGQGFFDAATQSCFACPEGYERADPSVPADEPEACRLSGATGIFRTAEDLGPPGCDADTFQIGDACYACPADMTPTGSGDPGSACLATN